MKDEDLTTVYLSGFYDGEKKWKDKIRKKIKEYDGLKEMDKMAYEEQIKPMQELLEGNNE